MIIYWPGVYTFNGYFSEEDLQMFWVYRYKGFSFTAARTVHTALVLAGQQGCSQADTGHLLLALVQTAQGTAADFLRRKRVTSTALATYSRSIGSSWTTSMPRPPRTNEGRTISG